MINFNNKFSLDDYLNHLEKALPSPGQPSPGLPPNSLGYSIAIKTLEKIAKIIEESEKSTANSPGMRATVNSPQLQSQLERIKRALTKIENVPENCGDAWSFPKDMKNGNTAGVSDEEIENLVEAARVKAIIRVKATAAENFEFGEFEKIDESTPVGKFEKLILDKLWLYGTDSQNNPLKPGEFLSELSASAAEMNKSGTFVWPSEKKGENLYIAVWMVHNALKANKKLTDIKALVVSWHKEQKEKKQEIVDGLLKEMKRTLDQKVKAKEIEEIDKKSIQEKEDSRLKKRVDDDLKEVEEGRDLVLGVLSKILPEPTTSSASASSAAAAATNISAASGAAGMKQEAQEKEGVAAPAAAGAASTAAAATAAQSTTQSAISLNDLKMSLAIGLGFEEQAFEKKPFMARFVRAFIDTFWQHKGSKNFSDGGFLEEMVQGSFYGNYLNASRGDSYVAFWARDRKNNCDYAGRTYYEAMSIVRDYLVAKGSGPNEIKEIKGQLAEFLKKGKVINGKNSHEDAHNQVIRVLDTVLEEQRQLS